MTGLRNLRAGAVAVVVFAVLLMPLRWTTHTLRVEGEFDLVIGVAALAMFLALLAVERRWVRRSNVDFWGVQAGPVSGVMALLVTWGAPWALLWALIAAASTGASVGLLIARHKRWVR